MGVYKLSNEAATDISDMYEFGISKFGSNQAQNYLFGLHKLFQTLADNTNIGRVASEFLPSLKRFVYKSHVVFYFVTDSGVFIIYKYVC